MEYGITFAEGQKRGKNQGNRHQGARLLGKTSDDLLLAHRPSTNDLESISGRNP